MTEQMLVEIFSAYGTVTDSKVLVNDGQSNDGTGQSVAIIRMGTEVEARWLIENLNGNIPQGLARPVEVSFAGSRSAAQGAPGPPRAAPYAAAPYAGAPAFGAPAFAPPPFAAVAKGQ